MTSGADLGTDVVLLAVLVPVVPFALELLALRRLTTAAFPEPVVATLPGVFAGLGVGFVVAAGIGAERSGARSLG